MGENKNKSKCKCKCDPRAVIKGYLLAYNALCCGLWLFTLVRAVRYLLDTNFDFGGVYSHMECLLQLTQSLAILEIVHSAIGFVRSPVSTTTIQVFSRLLLVWGVSYLAPPARVSKGFSLMLIGWCLAEVPRYFYYIINLVTPSPPFFLTLIRYSSFLVLYPAGISGEVLTIIASLAYFKDTGFYSLSMPNQLNFAFSYYYFLLFILAMYIPGSYVMYTYMLAQRKKVLSADNTKPKSQ